MKIKLHNVRLSFPNLFTPKSVNGSEPKFGASFLLSKEDDAAQIATIRNACNAVAKEQWPAKVPAGVKLCLHEGSEKEYDGYGETVMYVSASSTITPPVVDESLQAVTEHQGKVYPGCLVNVVLRLWAQDNQFGKRINAQLQAVQFAGEGEAFGEKAINPADEFKPLKGDTVESETSEFESVKVTKTQSDQPKSESDLRAELDRLLKPIATDADLYFREFTNSQGKSVSWLMPNETVKDLTLAQVKTILANKAKVVAQIQSAMDQVPM